MANKTVLITGGAGFIGSHLADELLARGYRVRALDDLVPQVHGDGRRRPQYLHADVDLVVGDVRDADAVDAALEGVDAVYHFAAAVGVGQSMYDVAQYTSVNNLGTAVLMERVIARKIRRVVVASSMSVYGEGLYRNADGHVCEATNGRSLDQLREGKWEVRDERDRPMTPVSTPETKSVTLESVYALSKYDQERMCLLLGRAYGIPTVALRFFNVFGTRQALSNPYTGVVAIFASRLLNRRAPLVFEDGGQRRDFIDVRDITRACVLALTRDGADGTVVNVGTGRPTSVLEVATTLRELLDLAAEPEIVGEYRAGDIRHCYADTRRAEELLGFRTEIGFEQGMRDLLGWLEGQEPVDAVDAARAELAARGLTR